MKRLFGLILAAALLLTGCAAKSQPAAASAVVDSMPLRYAKQFRVDYTAEGNALVTIGEEQWFLVVPEGQEPPADPQGLAVLRQPVKNIYLVSTSAMDFFVSLNGLSSIALSGTNPEGWYLPEAKQAMQQGQIAYAGKYSAPDYEAILNAGCELAVENTMIYHSPEVKEELERFGVPVLVERSSYESDPLARMEWVKLYGLLLGRTGEAEALFAEKEAELEPLLSAEPTGKTVAFFSVTTGGLATVRKSGDYLPRMIEMAGGRYIFENLEEQGSSLSTMNLPLETFYAGAKDADVLIYNSTIEGALETVEQLLDKSPLLAEFKAVQTGEVYCTSQSLFQQTMELGDLILDFHNVLTGGDPAELRFLTRLQ